MNQPGNVKIIILGAILSLLLISCQSTPENVAGLSGRVILWHSWSDSEAAVLAESLAEFKVINPNVSVVTVGLPPTELLNQYTRSAQDGFGPDLILGSSDWIADLAQRQLIKPLTPDERIALSLDTRSSELVRLEDQFYGAPLSLDPRALYYDIEKIERLPTSLDDLVFLAAQGNNVAFVPRFAEAYWGIQSFGQGLIDANGDLNLPESGFIEWLAWLNEAQNKPGVILNVDDDALRELFVERKIAFYVAGPARQSYFSQTMGPDTFGVTPLPDGPNGPSGPLLPAEIIMFYTFSSAEQSDIALALARFLTNQQQSVRFMRVINRVPANARVRVDARVYPTVAGFSKQARTAVILPNEIPFSQFYAAGDRAYANALSGALTPSEAVCRFGQEVIASQGYNLGDIILPEGCPIVEEIPNIQN